MHSFKNDYSEIAHPQILEFMLKINSEKNIGYGMDKHSEKAKDYIKKSLERQDVDIHFIPGGTHTNLLTISSMLRPYQAVISADTGHIHTNETGAIEATGHKVLTCKNIDGKITIDGIQDVLDKHTNEHVVMPKMVYISNSTELGTIYKRKELIALSTFCKEKSLILFMDGARIGSALMSEYNDLDLNEISRLVDAFYIGGTKNGALLGEALVICNDKYKKNFRYMIKQRGAMLAKGFVPGIQFEILFKDNLFFELARSANEKAKRLAAIIQTHGYEFYIEVQSNQIFAIFPNQMINDMAKYFLFEDEAIVDEDNNVIRFVTSWSTDEESIIAFDEFLRSY